MGIIYGNLNVDEKYSPIIEPNLYHNSVFIPGVTYTDQHEVGPAGQIMVHKLGTSAASLGAPGRDFVDTDAADVLIPIAVNNNLQSSKKIYGVQANAVQYKAGVEFLATAVSEVKDAWGQCGIACLAAESTKTKLTAKITNFSDALIDERAKIIGAKAKADVVLCSTEFFAGLLKEAGSKFTPIRNEKTAETGAIGMLHGMLIIECNGLSENSVSYNPYNYSGTPTTVTLRSSATKTTAPAFIMYDHRTLSIVNNLDAARIVDSENFVGSKAQVEMNSGYRVTTPEASHYVYTEI